MACSCAHMLLLATLAACAPIASQVHSLAPTSNWQLSFFAICSYIRLSAPRKRTACLQLSARQALIAAIAIPGIRDCPPRASARTGRKSLISHKVTGCRLVVAAAPLTLLVADDPIGRRCRSWQWPRPARARRAPPCTRCPPSTSRVPSRSRGVHPTPSRPPGGPSVTGPRPFLCVF